MKKFLSSLCATALAASFAIAGAMPVQAAPMMSKPVLQTGSDVVQVDHRRSHRRWDRRNYRRDNWRGDYRHRNYRNRDIGIGVGGAIAGALITGAIINSQSQPVYRERRVYREYGGNSHVSWCYNRYRSYRAADNTFQPYNGPRQQCYSPY